MAQMKKWIGIIKKEQETFGGMYHRELLCKFSDDIKRIKNWHKKAHPKWKIIIVKNTKRLNDFFKTFIDYDDFDY